MCLLLGKDTGYFQREIPRDEGTAEEIPAAIVNIHREIQGMRKQMETMAELTEKIFSKCNANTKQIEDVKVHVRALARQTMTGPVSSFRRHWQAEGLTGTTFCYRQMKRGLSVARL